MSYSRKTFSSATQFSFILPALTFALICLLGCRRIGDSTTRLMTQKENLAKQGDIPAAMWLAKHYDEGLEGVQRDPKRAFYWISKAAEQNDPAAQYAVASHYEGGNGVVKDDVKAVRWLERCANNGEGKWQGFALVALSNRYRHGVGVPHDELMAIELTAKAALQGESSAIFALAVRHLGQKDSVEEQHIGKVFLEVSAGRGNPIAQRLMAMGYENGLFLQPKDLPTAVKWARKAAEQGDPDAEYMLSDFLLGGRGVQKDEKQAAEWCLKAAEQGHAGAMMRIGKLYSQGIGVTKDMKLALHWGAKGANALLRVAEEKFQNHQISKKELEEAKRVARDLRNDASDL